MKNAENTITTNRFSFYVMMTTAIATLATFVIAFLTPPLSGPLCKDSCVEYPYVDIIARFPRDYIWMYPAMLVMLLYIILMVCIHHYAASEKKLFSHIGLSLGLMSGIILIGNYFVQVSVIQPSLLMGETEGIAILSQYNPHGIFIALEEVGFLLASTSFFCVAPVFQASSHLHKALRITLLSGFPLAVSSLTIIVVKYGIMREYLFEITVISIVWVQLIVTSILLSRVFKQRISAEI